jgi:Ni,Fe-hydrogenase I large subunit
MRGWPVSDALGALNVMGPTLEEMLLEEDARIQMQELQAEISEMKISDLELVAERLKSSWYEDVRPGLEPGEHLQAIYLELEIRRLL